MPIAAIEQPRSAGSSLASDVVRHRRALSFGQDHHVQTIFRHVDSAKREHLRIPSLLMRARAQGNCSGMEEATGLQAHSRIGIRSGCGLPVATGCDDSAPISSQNASSRHTKRREFITLFGGAVAAWPLAAQAALASEASGQRGDSKVQTRKPPTIGYLGGGGLDKSPRMGRPIRAAAARPRLDRGPHHRDRVPLGRGRRALCAIAAEFVRLKVDVILAGGTEPAIAAKQATSVIPIIFPTAGDPVGSRLVASLARPGGNAWPVEPGQRSACQAPRAPARGSSAPAPIGRHGQCRLFRRRDRGGAGRRGRARSASSSFPCRSGARRISRPPSTVSKAASRRFIRPATR